MLAKDTNSPFDSKDWIYEIKWDGYRAVADLTGDDIALYSRNGKDFTHKYPVLVTALQGLGHSAILDGEIVVLNEKGFPDFQKIQNYENNQGFTIQYNVFDLLSLNGQTLYDLPLIQRKALLKELLGETGDVIKYSDHIEEKGTAFFEAAISKDLEGVMAKKADSLYYPGKRTSEWLKIKGHKTADVIIAGFTAPAGSRQYFGSLVLGIKDGNALKHVGQAGTGYNDKLLKELYQLLKPLQQVDNPFHEKVHRERVGNLGKTHKNM